MDTQAPNIGPSRESGRHLAYRLRGTTAQTRAFEAVNGVPAIGPPYTDGQLCALYRVPRTQLKQAREINKAAGDKSPAPRNILRDRELGDLIDELSRAAHALDGALRDNRNVSFFAAADAVRALDDAADELTKFRDNQPVVSPLVSLIRNWIAAGDWGD